MLAQPLWKKLTIERQSSASPECTPEEYEGRYIVLSHVLYWTSYLMSMFENQIKHGNTYASLWRSEWLAMLWILWESQVPSRRLFCPTGDTKWPLECDWFTGSRCLHLCIACKGCDQSPCYLVASGWSDFPQSYTCLP